MKKFNGPSIIGAVLLFLLAAILSAAPLQAAVLADLTDAELADVTGQSGVTIWTSGAARFTADVMGFTDSSLLHALELHNVVVGGSSVSSIDDGGYYSWSTPIDFGPSPTLPPSLADLASAFKLNTIDVATILVPDVNGVLPGGPGYITTSQTLVVSQEATHVSPRWYSVGYWTNDATPVLVGGLVFSNTDTADPFFGNYSLGTLNLDGLSVGPTLQRYGAHVGGSCGIDFDYKTIISAEALRYTYNSSLDALKLNGIHLTDNTVTTEVGDNPSNPTTWIYTNAGNFKIGDIDAGHPATIDVDTDIAGDVSLHLNLPMQGTLRVKEVIVGANNFGPVAIDGIDVHRLNVKISAWP